MTGDVTTSPSQPVSTTLCTQHPQRDISAVSPTSRQSQRTLRSAAAVAEHAHTPASHPACKPAYQLGRVHPRHDVFAACSVLVLSSCQGFAADTYKMWCCAGGTCDNVFTQERIDDLGIGGRDPLAHIPCISVGGASRGFK